MSKVLKSNKITIFILFLILIIGIGITVVFAVQETNWASGKNSPSNSGGKCTTDGCWHSYPDTGGNAIRGARISLVNIESEKILKSIDYIFNPGAADVVKGALENGSQYYTFSSAKTSKYTYVKDSTISVNPVTASTFKPTWDIRYLSVTNYIDWFDTGGEYDSDIFKTYFTEKNGIEKVVNDMAVSSIDDNYYLIVEPLTVVTSNDMNYYGTIYELSKMAYTSNLKGVYRSMFNTARLEKEWEGFKGVAESSRTDNCLTESDGYGMAMFKVTDYVKPKTWNLTIEKYEKNPKTGATFIIKNMAGKFKFRVNCYDSTTNTLLFSEEHDLKDDGTITISDLEQNTQCQVQEIKLPNEYVEDVKNVIYPSKTTYYTSSNKTARIYNEKKKPVCEVLLGDILENYPKDKRKDNSAYKLALLDLYNSPKFGNTNFYGLLDFSGDNPTCDPISTPPKTSSSCMQPYSYKTTSDKLYTYIKDNVADKPDKINTKGIIIENGSEKAYCSITATSSNTYFSNRGYNNIERYPKIVAGQMLWNGEKDELLVDTDVTVTCIYVGHTDNGIVNMVSNKLKGINATDVSQLVKPTVKVNGKPLLTKLVNYEVEAEDIYSNSGDVYDYKWIIKYNYESTYSDDFTWKYIKGEGVAIDEDLCEEGKCSDYDYGIPTAINKKIDCSNSEKGCGVKLDVKVYKNTLEANDYCYYEADPILVEEELNLDFRVIDTTNPFPGNSGEGREAGVNWCAEDETYVTADVTGDGIIDFDDATGFQSIHGAYYSDQALAILRHRLNLEKLDFVDDEFKVKMPDCNVDNVLIRNEIINSQNSYSTNQPIFSITLNSQDIRTIRDYNENEEHPYDDFNLKCDSEGNECKSEFINQIFINELNLSDNAHNSLITGTCFDTNTEYRNYCVGL